MGSQSENQMKVVPGEFGYVLQDVPHLSDYVSDLQTYPNPLRFNPAYSVVKQYFVDMDDSVPEKIVVHKDTPRGIHFRRAGPRQQVYFASDDVLACIVTCGGLCPGLNTVIREIVHSLDYMYGVNEVLGIDGGYRGFYSKNTINLTPKKCNDIHKRGGTILGTSRGGHDTTKIVDSIQDRGINQACVSLYLTLQESINHSFWKLHPSYPVNCLALNKLHFGSDEQFTGSGLYYWRRWHPKRSSCNL